MLGRTRHTVPDVFPSLIDLGEQKVDFNIIPARKVSGV
jgi:hypothetical protein